VPIGAVIVVDGAVVADGFNTDLVHGSHRSRRDRRASTGGRPAAGNYRLGGSPCTSRWSRA